MKFLLGLSNSSVAHQLNGLDHVVVMETCGFVKRPVGHQFSSLVLEEMNRENNSSIKCVSIHETGK